MPSGERAACPSSSIVGRAPERTAEPPQEEAGPQGPRSMADEGVKGVMMVDSPPHQPQKKKKWVGLPGPFHSPRPRVLWVRTVLRECPRAAILTPMQKSESSQRGHFWTFLDNIQKGV